VKSAAFGTHSVDITSIVDAWINGGEPNYGLGVYVEDQFQGAGFSDGTTGTAPAITVTIAPIPTMTDTFGDGAIGTNADGVGNGFETIGNGLGTPVISESSGQAHVSITAHSHGNWGIVSRDKIDLTDATEVTVVWDIGSVSGSIANGLEMLVSQSNVFRSGGDDNIDFLFRPDGSANFGVQHGNTAKTPATSGSYTQADINDGFTMMLTADAAGWSASFVGLGDFAASGTYPTGLTFEDIFSEGFVMTHLQGGDETMDINAISFTAVPEPTTSALFAIGLFGLLACGRRRKR